MSDYEWIGSETTVANGGDATIALWGPQDPTEFANVPLNSYAPQAMTTDAAALGYFLRCILEVDFTLAANEANNVVFKWALRWVPDARLFDQGEVLPLRPGTLSSKHILGFGIEQVSTDGSNFLTIGTSGMEADVSSTREIEDYSGLVLIVDGPTGVVNYELMARILASDKAG